MITCPHCHAEFDPFPRRGSMPERLFEILRMSGDWVNSRYLTEVLYRRPYHPQDERTLRVHIYKLRRALVGRPWRIESGNRHNGLGYRLVMLDVVALDAAPRRDAA